MFSRISVLIGVPDKERRGVRLVAEIEVEVLDLAGPVSAQRSFDAAADHPSALRTIGREGRIDGPHQFGRVGLDVSERVAGGHIAQHRTIGDADAPARGAEPVELLAIGRGDAEYGKIGTIIAQAATLNIRLDAENDRPEYRTRLPVVADLGAAKSALRRRVDRIRRPRIEPILLKAIAANADAGVDADVKAGPVVDGCECWGFGVRSGGEVCGDRGGGSQANESGGQQVLLHFHLRHSQSGIPRTFQHTRCWHSECHYWIRILKL